MKIVINNPYRIVGVLVGATLRMQDRQIKRLKQFIDADQEPQDDYSFPVLGNLRRTLHRIEEAQSQLNLDSDRILAALFWFWDGNPITDEVAFDSLKDGNIEATHQIWNKLVIQTNEQGGVFWNNVTKKNFSAFHNYAVLSLISDKGLFVSAVLANIMFIESDYFDNFLKEVVDETYKCEKKDLELAFLKIISENSSNKQISELVKYLKNFDFLAKEDFFKRIIQKPIEQITQKIEIARNKRKSNKINAAEAGQELFTTTASDLKQLTNFVNKDDLSYSTVADKVANEILQCSIDYYNNNQDNDSGSDYTEVAMKLAKQAENIAVGKLTKDRIKESIETLEEMKDRELYQAIQLLQSVKEAYETNERKIREEVRRIEKTDNEIKLGYRSINWSAVEDNIRNSINWEEVNRLLISILSDNNLRKIKESDKDEKKKEFLELANWLKEKSKIAVVVIKIIGKYNIIPPKLPFKIIASTVTNTDNKPLYSKYVRYIGLNLNVEVTESISVDFHVKYFNPDGSINRSSVYSPEGYTLFVTKRLIQSTKSINLPGWGNSDKCTYNTGKHHIEVYVDKYMIHSVDFDVDIAPSEKLQIELKKAESKLAEIRNSEFFRNELVRARNEMNEIQKFQLFRSSSTKQLQILGHERKILSIKQRAEAEMKQQIEKQNKIIEKLKLDLQKAEC